MASHTTKVSIHGFTLLSDARHLRGIERITRSWIAQFIQHFSGLSQTAELNITTKDYAHDGEREGAENPKNKNR